MISLELAKKLKSAGLVWEPQIGDTFYWHNGKDWEIDALTSEDVNDRLEETKDFIDEGAWIFAPSLEQLLVEIEKRGYGWKLEKFHAYNLRRMEIYKVNDLLGCFGGNSPEEAAASALLWILEGGISDV